MSIKTDLGAYLADVGSDATIDSAIISSLSKLVALISRSGEWVNRASKTDIISKASKYDINNKFVLTIMQDRDIDDVPVVIRSVPLHVFRRASVSGSLYEASQYDPVFTIDGESIFISPDSSSSKTFISIPRITILNSDEYTDSKLPIELKDLFMLMASMCIVQARIDIYMATDEDSELVQLAQADLNTLAGMYGNTLQSFGLAEAKK